jgi:hypothetical protein
MGASGVSKADINSLKSQIASISKDVSNLKTQTNDPSSKTAASVNYQELADKIMSIDTYKDSIASKIADNPGALGENLAGKIGSNQATVQSITKGLETNSAFAQTLAGVLTDGSKPYISALKGPKGETGSLATSKEVVKQNLYDNKYTMWCADGGYCELPVGVKGIKIGKWAFEQHNNGNLHIHDGNMDSWSVAVEPQKFHARQIYSGPIHSGPLYLPHGWRIGGDAPPGANDHGAYFRFWKDDDIKAAFHEGGAYWGKPYGGIMHEWARREFSRKGHQHYNHAPNWETKETWGAINDPGN